MTLVTWDASYSVKVRRCDDDHKKLFLLVNTLHDAMLVGKGADVIQRVVEELFNYTVHHFSAEESMMEKTKCPNLAAHRHEHQELVKEVKRFRQDLVAGKGGQMIAVAVFLNDWLSQHIKKTDQEYSSRGEPA